MGDNSSQSHAGHAPAEDGHKQKIQRDIDNAGNGQKQQRGLAVAQPLQNTGVYIIPHVSHHAGEYHHHIDPSHTIGVGGHVHQPQQRPSQQHSRHSQRHGAYQHGVVNGPNGLAQVFPVPSAIKLRNHNSGAGAQPHKQGHQHKNNRKPGAHRRQSRVAHKIAHHNAIHHVIKLLEHIARQQRQGE